MAEHDKNHATTYYVNGEKQETNSKELTMKEIVENAGFTPASDYDLEDDANHKLFDDQAEAVHVHENQHFTATYNGVTPTS